jgi:chaperonin cofactor prefoldin
MIEKKFDNNFSTFESTYVSREGKSVGANDRKAEDIENRINVLYSKIAQLKSQRDHLQAA